MKPFKHVSNRNPFLVMLHRTWKLYTHAPSYHPFLVDEFLFHCDA